jgi:hypothetical protein
MGEHTSSYNGTHTEAVPSIRPSGINILQDLAFHGATGQNGRPIFEKLSKPEDVGVYMNPGIRYGHITNAGAYQELERHKQPFLDGFARLNELYFGESTPPPQAITLRELDELSTLALSAPLYCFVRGENPYPRHNALPVEITGMHQAAAGIQAVTDILRKSTDPEQLLSPTEVYIKSEKTGAVLDRDQACPATGKLMIDTLNAMMLRKGADPSMSTLSQHVPNFKQLKAFAPLRVQFGKLTGDLAVTAIRRIAAIERSSDRDQIETILQKYAEEEMKLLAVMNALQIQINRALGRSDGPLLTSDDVDARLKSNSPRVAAALKNYV